MLTKEYLGSVFAEAAPYAEYVLTGTAEQQAKWRTIHEQASLTAGQRKLLAGFTRPMKALVTSGMWCGDCVQQCPLLARIAEANTKVIDLRFVDRDARMDLSEQIKINDGLRVPTAIFMAEDDHFVSLMGDRPLTRYRAVASRQLGPACPLPGAPVPPEEMAATLQSWLDEFERVQLLLRLSPRLRQRHGD